MGTKKHRKKSATEGSGNAAEAVRTVAVRLETRGRGETQLKTYQQVQVRRCSVRAAVSRVFFL